MNENRNAWIIRGFQLQSLPIEKITNSEKTQLVALLKDIKKQPYSTPARGEMLEKLLWESDTPFNIKLGIAYAHFRAEPVAKWAWQHFAGEALIALAEAKPVTQVTAHFAALNANLNGAVLEVMMVSKAGGSATALNLLISLLSEEQLSADTLLQVTGAKTKKAIDKTRLYELVRKEFGLDQAIPDNWIEQMTK